MAVHLLIVDALNLIRRIHAVQGSPCVDTCLHALEQLIVEHKPKFIYLIPTFGNPSGGMLSLERRKRVLELAVQHNVLVVEDVLDDPPSAPACLAGKMACPPEDCGGLGGYEELAAWVRGGYDPRATPMGLGAQEMRDWLPRGWHPDRFSVTETNDALAASNMR